MKILVAIDSSQSSQFATEELGSRPWWGDTEFLLVHVAEIPTLHQWQAWGIQIDWQLRDKILGDGQKLVDDKVAQLKKMLAKGIKIEGKVIESEGRASDAIINEANNYQADLIVVGSHEGSDLGSRMFGDTSRAVMTQAACSVEIIKSGNTNPNASKLKVENISSAIF